MNKMAIRNMFVIVGRNLYTQDKEAAGHIYGIYPTYNSAMTALEEEVDKSTHGKFASWDEDDIKWEGNKGFDAHGNLVKVYMGDEYVYQLMEAKMF